MKILTENFQKKKAILFDIYDQVGSSIILPCQLGEEVLTIESLRNLKNNLSNERFIVAVCGQIKCGKSTLLNYLLFGGKEILPVNPTPWTAKLTLIDYDNSNYAEVEFYNRDEWKSLQTLEFTDPDDGIIYNYFEKYLREEVEFAASRGIYDSNIIEKTRKVIRLDNIEGLTDYVAHGGKYTPFVSNVHVKLNNKILKDITIVDTPGLNDANELRSRETSRWIQNANAVVYLFYIGRPLDRSDYQFIDRHLSLIPSEKILFSLSKIDLSEDPVRVSDYVEINLRNDKELKQRRFLENSRLHRVSTMAAIIKDKIERGEYLSEKEEFYQKKTPALLINARGNLPDLLRDIELHLMSDKGDAIIKSAVQKIRGLCNAKTREIESDLELSQKRLENLSLTSHEIEVKLEALRDVRDVIEKISYQYKQDGDRLLQKNLNKMVSKLSSTFSIIGNEIKSWLDDTDTTDAIKSTGRELKEIVLKKIRSEFNEFISESLADQLKDLYDKFKNDLRTATNNVFTGSSMYIFAPSLNLKEVLERIREMVSENLAPSHLVEFKERVWGFLWTKSKSTKLNILNEAKDCIEMIEKEVNETLEGRVSKEFRDAFTKMSNGVLNLLAKYQEQLRSIQETYDQKEVQITDSKAAISECEQRKVELAGFIALVERKLKEVE